MNAHKWSSKSVLSRAIQQSEFHQWICLKITSKLVSKFILSGIFLFSTGLDKFLVLCWYTCPFFLFFTYVRSSVITSTNMWMTNCRKHLFHPYNYFKKQWKLLLERLQSTGRGSELKWCGHFQHTLFTSDSRAHKLEKTGGLHALECVTSRRLSADRRCQSARAFLLSVNWPRCFASEETGSKTCSNFLGHGIVFFWFSVSIHVGLQNLYCYIVGKKMNP